MTYELVYTQRAKRDLNAATDAIAARAPHTGQRWFEGFLATLDKLRQDPNIFGLAPESDRCSIEIRQIIYRIKSRRANRALYTIRKSTVIVLAIRRPGQDLLTDEELRQSIAELD